VQAKRRVYHLRQAGSRDKPTESSKRKRSEGEQKAGAGADLDSDHAEIVPVLEPLPKWELVKDILQARTLLPCSCQQRRCTHKAIMKDLCVSPARGA
jgi:hypothetical protein